MYQSLTIVGNVGKAPEMRYTPKGEPVTNFSVATNRQWTDAAGQVVKETCWFNVTCWGKQAEAVNQYVHKGSKVLVEGRLTPDKATGGPRVWTRQDGSAGSNYEVTATTVRFLGGGEQGEHQAAGADDPFSAPDYQIPF